MLNTVPVSSAMDPLRITGEPLGKHILKRAKIMEGWEGTEKKGCEVQWQTRKRKERKGQRSRKCPILDQESAQKHCGLWSKEWRRETALTTTLCATQCLPEGTV